MNNHECLAYLYEGFKINLLDFPTSICDLFPEIECEEVWSRIERADIAVEEIRRWNNGTQDN